MFETFKNFTRDFSLGVKSLFNKRDITESDYESRLDNYSLKRIKQISHLQNEQQKEIERWQTRKEKVNNYKKMFLINGIFSYLSKEIDEKIKIKEAKIEVLGKAKIVLSTIGIKWRNSALNSIKNNQNDHFSENKFKVYDDYKNDFKTNINQENNNYAWTGTYFYSFFNPASDMSSRGARTGNLLEKISLDMKTKKFFDEQYQSKNDNVQSVKNTFSSL